MVSVGGATTRGAERLKAVGVPAPSRGVRWGVALALVTGSTLAAAPAAIADFGVIDQWGGGGTGPGKFAAPVDVAVDANGNTYVVDSVRSDVQKFDAAGNFVTSWGAPTGKACVSEESPPGQLCHPQGIAVHAGSAGTEVFVVDTYDGRIQVFDPDGQFKRSWGSSHCANLGPDADPPTFCYPQRLAISPAGNVYVQDAGAKIQTFSSDGKPLHQWPGPLCDLGGCYNQALAVGDALFVADTYWAMIGAQDPSVDTPPFGGTINQGLWGGPGAATSKFGSDPVRIGPLGLAIGPDDNLYVADSANDRIQVFKGTGSPKLDGLGEFDFAFGSQGAGTGQFDYPHGIAVDDAGNVYVADTGNDRIVKLGETSGQPLEPLTPPDATPLELAGVATQHHTIRVSGADPRANKPPRTTLIRYQLNEPATVEFTFRRIGGGGSRVSVSKSGFAGPNSWSFLGNPRRNALRPGRYLVRAVATNEEGSSEPLSIRIRMAGRR